MFWVWLCIKNGYAKGGHRACAGSVYLTTGNVAFRSYTIVNEWLVINLKQNEAQSARAESTHNGVH